MRNLFVLAIMASLEVGAVSSHAENPKVLIYTRNYVSTGKGFVHDNIAVCTEMLQQLGKDNGFATDASDNPEVFTDTNLKQYRVIIFANSNNEAFATEDQKAAFQRFIRAGAGFVGIHSATGSERKWPWFWAMIGGTFSFHAPLQKFTVNVVDKNHPSTSDLPGDTWPWEDEFYVMKEQPKGLRVLLAGNIKPLKMPDKQRQLADAMPDSIPLAWCHEFEGARVWYTALGHKKEHYADPNLQKHILGGIRWAMNQQEKAE